MIRLSPLASSSKGNATVISGGGTHLLVDTGISATRIRKGLAECGLGVCDLSGVLFTHEHTDHTCGLGILSKKDNLHIYCTRYQGQDLRAMAASSARFTYIEPGSPVQIGAITATPFAVSHDATDPVGYLFECEGVKLGYITDTGRIMRGMDTLLSGVHGLYLESNYDEKMLHNSGRPMALIERIESNWGHLSNEQAGEFVRQIAHPKLQHIVLAHISQDCNTPEKAYHTMQQTLNELELPTQLVCAPAAYRLPWIELNH
jgi:phosphoribosyl 1,2-cyclic phosphodiesterase